MIRTRQRLGRRKLLAGAGAALMVAAARQFIDRYPAKIRRSAARTDRRLDAAERGLRARQSPVRRALFAAQYADDVQYPCLRQAAHDGFCRAEAELAVNTITSLYRPA
jgi:hypothetical protein